VSEDWDAQVAQRIEDRSAYYDQLRKYDLNALAPASLANLIEYFLAMGKPDDALRAGEALLAPASAASAASSAPSASPARPQRASTSDAALLRAAHLLEEVLLPPGFPPGSKRDPQRTLRLYSAAETRVADARSKAELALAQGDVLFEELRKLDEARADYDKVLKEYRRPENSLEARRAYFGLGRVARWQGNRTEADQWFSKAQAIPVGEGSAEKLVVRRSAWARAVEDALKREEPEVSADAWQQLVTWAWYYPEDLLAGHHTLLLARLLLKQKAPQRAAEELEALLKANPESQFADQALWSLVDAYLALGKRPEAVSALDRLARDYPASGLIPKLEARRRQVETGVLR
jgi:tetratricopeptide (TPR) repeat protein